MVPSLRSLCMKKLNESERYTVTIDPNNMRIGFDDSECPWDLEQNELDMIKDPIRIENFSSYLDDFDDEDDIRQQYIGYNRDEIITNRKDRRFNRKDSELNDYADRW